MKKTFKSHKKKKHAFLLWVILGICSVFLNQLLIENVSSAYLLDRDLKDVKFHLDTKKILLFLGFNYKEKEMSPVTKETTTTKVEVPVFNETYLKPSIYIYNTHQTEEYKDGDVLKAAEYLKAQLEPHDIEVIVETTNIKEALKKGNLAYKDSYKITRELLNQHINDNTVLYIDLHRDSASYSTATTEWNGKKYARMMFVIGGKHETYKNNYRIADDLNKRLKNQYAKLSRGIFVRENSSYNQDLNSNVILIEVGGPHNTMEEVQNSLQIFKNILLEYIGE